MKKLLTSLLLVLSLTGYSQSRVGIPISRVRNEYADPKYALKFMKIDSSAYLVVQDKHAFITHRFGIDSLCNKTYVTLADTILAFQIARTYDAIYEPKSSSEWIARLPHDTLDVELVEIRSQDGMRMPTFQWSASKKDKP